MEVRPTGSWWRGWSASRDMAPDGRVSISHLMLFRSRRELDSVYVHETVHSLLHDVPGAVPGHDATFFSLSVAIRQRIGHLGGDPVSMLSMMSLYDLADLPIELADDVDAGLGRCVTWSVATAEALAFSDLTAERLAVEIVARYQTWLAELRDRPRLSRISQRRALGQAAALERLKDRLFVSTLVASFSAVMLVLITLMKVVR